MKDIYTDVTNRIIEALETGTPPWIQPWSDHTALPSNLSTGKPYRGINILMLSIEAMSQGYPDSRWVTLREIVLPVVKPGIIAGCILVFVPSLGAFLAPDLLGGAKTFMIGSLIDEQFRGSQGNWPFGAAAAMILMTLVLIVLMIYARAQTKAEAR